MNRNKVGIKQLFLDSAEYPLEDVIEVKSHCSALPPILAINFGGFLVVSLCFDYFLRRGIEKAPKDSD